MPDRAARGARMNRSFVCLLLLFFMAVPMTRGAYAEEESPDTLSESDQLLGLKKSPPPAQVIPGVASVDLAMLMLLHPRMQHYNFSAGDFEKEFPAKSTPEGRARIAGERAQERARTFEANRARYDEIARQRGELTSEIGKAQMELNREILETKNQAGQIDVAQAIAKLEESFWKKKQTLEAEWLKLNAEMVAMNEEADQKAFAGTEARQKSLLAIETEVLEAIQAVSKGRGYGTVLNSSFVLAEVAAQKRKEAPESLPYLEPFDNPYNSFWNDPREKAAAGEAAMRQASQIQRWVAFRPKMLDTVLNRPINRLVLTGGRDLTLDVLAYLLRKYRVAEDRARLLLETLQTMQRRG